MYPRSELLLPSVLLIHFSVGVTPSCSTASPAHTLPLESFEFEAQRIVYICPSTKPKFPVGSLIAISADELPSACAVGENGKRPLFELGPKDDVSSWPATASAGISTPS